MTLPYPFEVETGRLWPRAWAPRAPFDVEQHLERALRVSGTQVEVFGVRLDTPEPHDALQTVKHFRDALRARFNGWRPGADAATWELFESQARPALQGLERADDETLRILLLTISGL
jgi:hypothetical protein